MASFLLGAGLGLVVTSMILVVLGPKLNPLAMQYGLLAVALLLGSIAASQIESEK